MSLFDRFRKNLRPPRMWNRPLLLRKLRLENRMTKTTRLGGMLARYTITV